jgi:hypothetical protein
MTLEQSYVYNFAKAEKYILKLGLSESLRQISDKDGARVLTITIQPILELLLLDLLSLDGGNIVGSFLVVDWLEIISVMITASLKRCWSAHVTTVKS